ncbi:DEAD/DEAH box helicase [Heterostelium album PN500]|uniref:RNA helicase n=1 Tax=Heterostelium pallidum (strain ATCC 26659 / Pp 5 / PN500) TaxID=670386 RepID=D3BTE7_HETP5|nr:DEAD/DEAH box helicase [Heterostelium album PN500]EFA75364.1 DEAD/DEAH box helicase [Heterostelium album PN500]|eukprot:XP_020427498.1 DEAD/DEAH box helicase [Heterostelium album PN500]
MSNQQQQQQKQQLSVFDRELSDSNNLSDYLVYGNASKQKLSIAQQRIALPIFQLRRQILYLLETYQTLVVVGQTGCGKTTQLPQYLVESGWADGGRMIVCTQPRRVAAMSVATRVAEEMSTPLGERVGYAVRFEESINARTTQIKYCTDGMLIREMMIDPLLQRYPVVMIDEAHERTLATDVLMGLLKKVQQRRPDLKIIVSSATLDAEDMFNFFNQRKHANNDVDVDKDTATIISIDGRNYPVDIHYLTKPTLNYLETTVTTIVDIHNTQPPGDILVFLTGQEEIERIKHSLDERLSSETSITIDGISYVVDSGFVKIKTYNGHSGLESLVVVPTSQASANQRAGRAGRNKPGKCYRLYTQDDYTKLLEQQTRPEIQRSSLTALVLQLKSLGIDNVLNFDFVSPPPLEAMTRALEILYALGALDDDARLTTPIGHIMSEFPVDPQFARMIIASADYGCSEEIVSITAMLSIQGLFVNQNNHSSQRHQFTVKEGDHLTLLNIYNQFIKRKSDSNWCHEHQLNYKAMLRAIQVRKQLVAYTKKYGIKLVSCILNSKNIDVTVPIRKSIVTGFFTNAAHLQSDGSYQTIKDKHVRKRNNN